MKHVIVGTAGHVDHGKTCLIKALTGIDTDRLKEEKKRGITIELGFAYLDMPDGHRVGIVDVPGHEKFIKNMLAGAGGIDVAMLIVAADEGVMPQTVEHLDILSILGIEKGIVVITKTDLVEQEFLDLVKEDINTLIEDTFLEKAPVAMVSVYENAGVEELKCLIQEIVQQIPQKNTPSVFRMPIDRVFTLKGFGTVVTGTLTEGKLAGEQTALIYPGEKPVKIRTIQVHSKEVPAAYAGQRAAVNVANWKKEDIKRGEVIASVGSLYPTMMADVKLEVLKHTSRSVKNGSRVHIYHGTKELLGKVILMGVDEITAGNWGYAQLRLEEETVLKKGDRFVIRFYSPLETVGGGVVLDALPRKHRRNDKKALLGFGMKESGSQLEQLEVSLQEHWGEFRTLPELCERSGLDKSVLKNNSRKLAQEGKAVFLTETVIIHREELEAYEGRMIKFLDNFHKHEPLKEGMPLEEFRSRLQINANMEILDGLTEYWISQKQIKKTNHLISRYRFFVVIKDDENSLLQRIVNDYLAAGFAPLTTGSYSKEFAGNKKFKSVFTALLKSKTLIRLDNQYCVHMDWYQKAQETFKKLAFQQDFVLLGEYRDALECSRKVAVALLEYFDKNGFTKKIDAGRILAGEVHIQK